MKKQTDEMTAAAIVIVLALVIGYGFWKNHTSHYFRLSSKAGISDTIELYHGKAGTFNLQEFEAELNFERHQIEPDKLFTKKQIANYDDLNNELIGHLTIVEKIKACLETGEIVKAFELANIDVSDYDKNTRIEIIHALGSFGSEKSIEILKEHLNAGSSYIRAAIAHAFGKIGSEIAVEPLIALLKDQSDYVRSSAAEALGKVGSEIAIVPLIALSEDRDAFVRRNAAEALGNIGTEKAIEPLIALAMLKDKDWGVQRNTAEALGKIGSEIAVEPLIALLKDQSPLVRVNAAYGLGKIGSEIAVEPLIALAMLKDKNETVQREAAFALRNIGTEKAVEALTAMLKDQDWRVRNNAAEALGKLDTVIAIEPLIAMLKNSFRDDRNSAVSGLGKIGSEKAVEPLIAMLKDESGYVRSNAAYGLGKIGSEKAVEPLIAMLKDKDKDVREKAAEALGKLGSEKAVEPLIALLRDQDAYVGFNAESALKKIGAAITLYLSKDEKSENKIKSYKQKAKSKKNELPEIFDALKIIATDKKERMSNRVAAIAGLGNIRTEESLDLLLQIFETEDSSYQFRAIQALGNNGYLNPSKAVEPLLKRLKALEDRKAAWRKIRDENTDSYGDLDTENWSNRLESVKPKPYLECELAYAIARITPDTEGIKLLNHDLAAVREGAWLGIGKVGTVELLKKLYEERRRKDITPWFRHAAYRAIDHVLIHLEAFGNTEDADELEKFLSEVSEKDEPGVHTRTKWTMDRLRESTLK